jgi:hypothetical protein
LSRRTISSPKAITIDSPNPNINHSIPVENSDFDEFIKHWQNKEVYIKTISLTKTKSSQFTEVKASIEQYDREKETKTPLFYIWCLRKEKYYSNGGTFYFRFETGNFCQ